uniref:CCHC-type domain-containing protein n=1 Tax=Glossina pallidipes TaxID=7398 RepID=A0A1A9Z683_GLOPL
MNAQEEDADALRNEIKALKKIWLQTNEVTTSSIKVKTPLFGSTTNFNAFKLQFGVVATKNTTSPKTTCTETLGFALTQEAASELWTSNMKVRRTEVSSENDISDVVCEAVRQALRENKRMPVSKTRKCYVCNKRGHFAREGRTHSTPPTRNISERAGEISNEQALN